MKSLPLVVEGYAQPIDSVNKLKNGLLKIYGKQF